ncbi:putative lactoylglutathione lyase [Kribbella amoyensis]|uniref:Putative lactoylglutathione lyase n=1 Tax=Kribbella amoyensis TaxID=996641 RepID=A0A561BTM8_9ACTN|nr:VOC family protein [Kribbella amoyensis]TWD82199.1 putative lactoylglutathione lyase [Kribbella amoyensis]
MSDQPQNPAVDTPAVDTPAVDAQAADTSAGEGLGPATAPVLPGAFLLELVPVPVTDLDRSKAFYQRAGFHVDVDMTPAEGVRIVQVTPPGSFCSILLAEGIAQFDMPAGTLRGLHLVVADIEAARADLIGRGIEVSPTEDLGGVFYAWFADPDGNTWTVQHMPWRQ